MAARRRVVEAPRSKRVALEVENIRVVVMDDDDPDMSLIEDRRTEYNRGAFKFVGVRAEAEVVIEGVIQTLTSGGLWGIESDSGEYIQEVAQEEYEDLRKILITIGVSTSQLPLKIERGWMQWRT